MSTTMDINVKALIAFMRVFIPGMKKNGFGHIINISSNAANYTAPGNI